MNNQPKKTNELCIAGFICAFLVAPVGLVLSIIGVNQAKKKNEDGATLGIVGIVIGAINTFFQLIAIILWIVVYAFMLFEYL